MLVIFPRRFKVIGLFFLSLLFICFTSTIPVHASNQLNNISKDYAIANTSDPTLKELPFYWDSIDVDIQVEENGDMLVTEAQEYVFNQQHSNQRYRYIPLDKVDDIKNVSVTENGNFIPFQFGRKNNQLWIRWKHELNPPESHTFVIKYRVVGGLHLNSNTTQVYWKAIFGDRSSPIQNAKVTVRLPKSLAGKVTSFNYFPLNIPVYLRKIDSQTVEYIAQKPMLEGQELEVKVVFPNNILDMPKPKWQQSIVLPKKDLNTNSNDLNINDWLAIIFGLFFLLVLLLGVLGSSSSKSNSSLSSRSNSSRSKGYYGGGAGAGGGCGGSGGGGGGGGGSGGGGGCGGGGGGGG